MKGGKRLGAGRSVLPSEDKKDGYKIYISKILKDDINELGIGNSFSTKCVQLLSSQIQYLKSTDEVRYIDLFAGLGGIRIGFEQGFNMQGIKTRCVFSSEIKPYAIEAYKRYFDEDTVWGDITTVSSDSIPNFDFLLAGFPCQPFSSAGKGLGFEDTRGTLFFEIERILRDKNPMGFLLENVEGLVSHNKGETLSVIIKRLENLGYFVSYKLLDSQHFGLAQSRKRVYIVGTHINKIPLNDFPENKKKLCDILETNIKTVQSHFTQKLLEHYTAKEIVGKAIKDKRGGKNNIHSWDFELKGKTSNEQRELLNQLLKERRKQCWAEEIGIKWMDGMPLTAEQIYRFFPHPQLQEMLDDLVSKGYLTLEYPRKQENGVRIPDSTKSLGYNIVAGKLSFEFTRILDPNNIAPTLVAMDVAHLGVVDGIGIRKLTIREGQRLCGFPEDYDLTFLKSSEAFDLLGNTVCIPVIASIAERMAKLMG